jgi:hypothetical protein
VHCKYIPIYIQQDATLDSLFISENCSTCFGLYFHPSSRAHTTVSKASGICQVIQQDATLHSLFYLETVLHVLGGTFTHHQERIELYLPHLVFVRSSNKMQRYTVYFIWKLLYMFRVVPPPNIRSVYNVIYSIWYLSHRYCYLPLSWRSWNWFECAVGGVRHPQHTQTFPR